MKGRMERGRKKRAARMSALDGSRRTPMENAGSSPVRQSLGWILGGAAAAVGFIALVGPAFGS